MEWLMLAGVIVTLSLVIGFSAWGGVAEWRRSSVDGALLEVRDAVESLQGLGRDSARVVTVDIPAGVSEAVVEDRGIEVVVGGRVFVEEMPLPVQGSFPTVEGRHRVRMFFNGSVVVLYECGNGVVEAFEQCDADQNYFCDGGRDAC